MIDGEKKSNEEKALAKEQDEYLNEALDETFPASDSISPGHPEKAKPETAKQ